MVRENLVTSAVSFLQDPSVVSSALEQRISFLRSKNLTQEEIDVSLARAGDGSSIPPPATQQSYEYSNQQIRQPAGYQYGSYQGPWGLPEPPRRDWRDWFIVATVSTGVSYGLYVVAKRYILPLISPPTPPQLASDKASIDEAFSRAFALIDQLAIDTAALKSSEAERTEKLDATLQDVDSVLADLKAANSRREAESSILADQVQGLKESIPKALEGWKAAGDSKLEDLGTELRSLKKLIGNRVGAGAAPQQVGRPYTGFSARDKSSSNSLPAPGRNDGDAQDDGPAAAVKREGSGSYQARAAIPAWQMAAAGEKSDDVPKVGEASEPRA